MKPIMLYTCIIFATTLCWKQALFCGDPHSSVVTPKAAAPALDDYIIKKSNPLVVTDEASFETAVQASVENAKTFTTTVIASKGNVTLTKSHSLEGNIEFYPTSTGCSLTYPADSLEEISFTGFAHHFSSVLIGHADTSLPLTIVAMLSSKSNQRLYMTIQNCSLKPARQEKFYAASTIAGLCHKRSYS